MKKLISIILILCLLTVSVCAGSVPEDLLSGDEAKVFVGTVESFTTKEIEGSSQVYIDTVEVIPTEKIKGDVTVGVKETYTDVNAVLDLQKDTEYLFGYIDEINFYIYEIESRDGEKFQLVNSDKYDMTKRLEDYLNDGAFAVFEQERLTHGTQISFLEYLCDGPSFNDSDIDKVTFRIQDELHEVDKDEFFKIAKDIMITGVKNDVLEDMKDDLYSSSSVSVEYPYKTILYIELLDANERAVHFGAVSRHGEVDRYSLFMSRIMMKDYEMSSDDLDKLYSLIPGGVTIAPDISPEELTTLPLELPQVPKKNYSPYIWGGAALIFAVAFAAGVAFYSKKRK